MSLTLAELSTFICNRINQSDATSVSICKEFIKRRFQMIYEMRNWRDSLKNVAATLSDTTNGYLTMPTDIERPVSIRLDGTTTLWPIDSPTMLQLDPASFERSATPLAFEEFTDETTTPVTRKIRFVPIPSKSFALLITGKRPLTNLSADSDVPILRNIDNALIAFVTADMLERQRQYGKAQAKVQEASALLEEMIKVETRNAANMPRLIPYTEPIYCPDSSDTWLSRT